MAVTITGSMCGTRASIKRTLCRSVSSRIGDRRPISLYFPATGTERFEEMSLAMGRRNHPSGPSGIMSGSRNKLRRKGSTASSESGPPNWNNTIPIRFFPAKLTLLDRCCGSFRDIGVPVRTGKTRALSFSSRNLLTVITFLYSTSPSAALLLRATCSCAARRKCNTRRKWPSPRDMPPAHYPDFSSNLCLPSQVLYPGTQCLQPVPCAQKQNQQPRQRPPHQQIRNTHPRFQPRTRSAQDHRLRVLCPPPANRKIQQRHVQKRKNAEQRAEHRPLVRLFNHRAQQQVGKIEQPEHKRQRQPRVPGPPDSPHRMRPDRAGNQYHGNERQPHFRRRHAQPIRLRLAGKHVSKVRVETRPESHERAERAGNVQVENLLDHAHGLLDGRVVKK